MAANTQRVKEYLRQHDIAVLFEEMMGKLKSDLPDDPIKYLLNFLQRMLDEKGVNGSESSRNIMTASASQSRQDKDSYSKLRSSGFDDIWTQNKSEKPQSNLRLTDRSANQSSLDTAQLFSSLNQQTSADESLKLRNSWLKGKADDLFKKILTDKDIMSQEVPFSLRATLSEPDSTNKREPGKPASFMANPKFQTKKKVLLQQLDEKQAEVDSGYCEEHDLIHDNAAELFENEDDLRREGASVSCNVTDDNTRQIVHRAPVSIAPDKTNVAVCARCARVIDGDHGNEAVVAKSTKIPESIDSDEDEEFESVSQVTGPRRPIWNDSDSDANQAKSQIFAASTRSRTTLAGSGKHVSKSFENQSQSRPITKQTRQPPMLEDDDRMLHKLTGAGWHIPDNNDTDDSTAYVTKDNSGGKSDRKPRVY